MQRAIMVSDIKNLFDPSKRGSIAFDIDGRPDCYLSVCVVVLDDFHIFSFEEPVLSGKLMKHLSAYAKSHPKVLFIIIVESTSIIENFLEAKKRMNNFLIDLHHHDDPVYGYEEQELDYMLVKQVPCFSNLTDYKLLPFASLNEHRRNWEQLLYEATKKKLEIFARNSQTFLHNMYSNSEFSPPLAAPASIVSSVPTYISEEVVQEILHSAFSVEQRLETAPGMRSIEQTWSPQIHYALKKYYSTSYNPKYPCLGYLSIDLKPTTNTAFGRDIVCTCKASQLSRWTLETAVTISRIPWQKYVPLLESLRLASAAFEKVLNN
eukprot:TRINITY_DN8824_c0_g1_i2.p1 TRINITY_DN8824_c0_g1~~TRINITY_DN8824_c0_g1_i2.p1  ORF type:complete len:321 (+),score=69.77 TRINITY_DN8824_c0_g1_i2:848-1810(+)